MVMVPSVLATELQNLTPTDTEATAITRLVDAYGVFASGASTPTAPLTPAGVNLGKAAMSPALVGMATGGLTQIPLAILAFWTAVAAGGVVSFPTSTAITPPPHALLPTTFPATCMANTVGELSLADSANALATVIHADAIIGGTVTYSSGTEPIT